MYNDCDGRCLDGDIFDRGSTPRRSTKTEQVNLCICYYRIQEYVLFGVFEESNDSDVFCRE